MENEFSSMTKAFEVGSTFFFRFPSDHICNAGNRVKKLSIIGQHASKQFFACEACSKEMSIRDTWTHSWLALRKDLFTVLEYCEWRIMAM